MEEPVRVLFCWSNVSGYMAACWRELAGRDGIQMHVLAFGQDASDGNAPFDQSAVMRGVPWRPLTGREREDSDSVGHLVEDFAPDVIVMSGWFVPAYVALTRRPRLRNCRFILTADTPWRGDLRQHLARFRMSRFLNRFERIVVPGERGFQYARRLGFEERQISRGLYGIDFSAFSAAARDRPAAWPRRFLFVGRYDRVKGIDVLVDAYQRYRRATDTPWKLTCCGRGPESDALAGIEGLEDRGFVQPADQPALFAQHGVFVLSSRYDPWPLVLVEACAAGLPVICTQACGSAVENVRPYHNGIMIATDDAVALASAMQYLHEQGPSRLREMGTASTPFAAAYAAPVWADRWMESLRHG